VYLITNNPQPDHDLRGSSRSGVVQAVADGTLRLIGVAGFAAAPGLILPAIL
jgi:hypothetical protein